MSKPVFEAQVNTISDAFSKAVEFDMKVAEDKHQYSSWLLAIATAGFSIAVAQSETIIKATLWKELLSPDQSKGVLLFAAALFIISAVAGAIVKLFINNFLLASRQRQTYILKQKIYFEAGEHMPLKEPNVQNLLSSVTQGELLPEGDRLSYSNWSEKDKKATKIYERFLTVQQIFVGISYVLLFVAALL